MSLFDLFRGFFGVPGGHYRGDGRREPFFDGMTHDEDDDDDDDAFRSEDHFGDAFRFGFSVGPDEMFVHEPVFGQMLREMEELFAGLGGFGQGLPSIEIPHQDRPERNERRGGGSGNSLRDFMLKTPDDSLHSPPSVKPKHGDPSSVIPDIPSRPFHHWPPFSRFKEIWSDGPTHRDVEKKEDGDLDSQVSSGGLDQILTPAPSQPKTRSFFQSVTVTKVVKPDGTVEERRTIRDGQGNEETTVTRSGGPEDQSGPLKAGGPQPFPDMQDTFSVFTKFFGGFKG